MLFSLLLVKHLKTFAAGSNCCIILAAAEYCFHLTCLDLKEVLQYPTEVVKLLAHSPKLMQLRLSDISTVIEEKGLSDNAFLFSASLYCTQLESCIIRGIAIDPDALSALFNKCTCLKKFQYSSYITQDLCLESRGVWNSERYPMSLLLKLSLPKSIRESILKHYPGIKSLNIPSYTSEDESSLSDILQSLPDLTSLTVISQSLTSCVIDSAVLKGLHLRRLTLLSCVYDSSMLSVIAN